MGDTLLLKAGNSIHIAVHVKGVNGAHILVIADGVKQPAGQGTLIDGDDTQLSLDWDGSKVRKWIRLDICSPDGHRLLIGNPIYLHWLQAP